MFTTVTTRLLMPALVFAGLSGAAYAQEATQPAAKLLLTKASGQQIEYSVTDASFYVSTTPGYDGSPASVDFSMSLSTITPIDANLLEWSAQTGGKSKDDLRTVTVIGNVGLENEIRYEITEAQVTSVSFSQSAYTPPSVSLSLMAGTLSVSGVPMN